MQKKELPKRTSGGNVGEQGLRSKKYRALYWPQEGWGDYWMLMSNRNPMLFPTMES